MKLKSKYISLPVLLVLLCSCSRGWTLQERMIIRDETPLMRVLTIASPYDSVVLRQPCKSITEDMLASAEYRTLAERMVTTVTDPSQDGVGIAGPQVGILRRIVAVQRLDKPGEPFEVYPNIRITAYRGEPEPGQEGCLSVPDCRGTVMRSRDIDITYTSMAALTDTTETVRGFTAVIFQHECDHLDGILYIDRIR